MKIEGYSLACCILPEQLCYFISRSDRLPFISIIEVNSEAHESIAYNMDHRSFEACRY